ncbi:tyrosine kinase catalytic domain protein [Rhizoctonia solani AG-3 Rhs1AP]|uniref:Tyrosine kinase catalytic domain protein n=1 Tax=Rhizoctonia solani AG-3 Rhs1AP TaxID=1086054 RepID=A0A0A1UK47_9AGAM|nr:tyrosine kinase catalytic domain protein [Rhizoctonia solani AG-3 Rhs1AP]
MSQVAIMGPQPPTLSLSDASDMTLAQVAAGLASVPDVNSLLEVLKDLFVAVEKVAVNRDQWKILRGRCVMVAYISISYVMSNQKAGYPTLPNATEHLQWTIKGIIRTVDHWQRNYHAQFFDTTDCVLVGHAIVEQFSVLDTYLANYIPFDADATALPLQELQAAQRNAVEWLEYLKYHSRATVESGPGRESDRESDRLSIPLLEIEVERRHRIFQNPDQKTVAEYVAAEDFLQVIQNVTDIQLPPTLLTGRQCVQLSPLPIRSGIHCDVYKASFLNGLVAKKVFRLDTTEKSSIAKYSEKLVEDAKLWAKFRSAYTLPFYGVGMETVGRDKVQLYMVSPLMKNLDAASYLKTYRNNPNMREGVMRIITDAAAGLKYLHGLNPTVVHSGMRGENILVTDSGGGLLGGFAFTKELLPGASGDTKPVTDAPQAVLNGKVDDCRWMAPETLSSSGLVLQTSSDVWRWAMTALELITGRLPYYETKDPKVVIDKVISKKLPARVDYTEFETHSLKPDDMWRLLESCWTYMPEDRPTIDKVIEKLQEISSPKKISAAGSNVMQATGSETWIQQFPDIDWDLCEPDDPDAIPESYLVYLKPEQDRDLHIKQMEDSAKEYHASGEKIYVVEHRFHVIDAYSAKLTNEGLRFVASSNQVTRISQDRMGDSESDDDDDDNDDDDDGVRTNATWNLEAISSREPMVQGARAPN